MWFNIIVNISSFDVKPLEGAPSELKYLGRYFSLLGSERVR